VKKITNFLSPVNFCGFTRVLAVSVGRFGSGKSDGRWGLSVDGPNALHAGWGLAQSGI
jgi:hypothetical protein